jgi:hypothetical protein
MLLVIPPSLGAFLLFITSIAVLYFFQRVLSIIRRQDGPSYLRSDCFLIV